MTYEGYLARIEYDDEDKVFTGRLAGIRDIVTFHEAVDGYLAACEKLGQKPEKPASGNLMLRIPPEVHQAAIAAAQATGSSLNQWAAKALTKAAGA